MALRNSARQMFLFLKVAGDAVGEDGRRLLGAHLCGGAHRAHLVLDLVDGLWNLPGGQVLILPPGAVEEAAGEPGGSVLHGCGGDGGRRRHRTADPVFLLELYARNLYTPRRRGSHTLQVLYHLYI